MRPQFIAVTLLLAFGVLGVALLISRTFHHELGGEAPEKLPVAQREATISPKKELSTPASPVAANDRATVAVAPVSQEPNHADYVSKRVAELMALAMNDDSNSLYTIWSELSNPDKEIRAGALEAVVQFGDRSVVPNLRALAAQTEDPAEKASIVAAADHLELPTLSELRRAQQANGPQLSH